MRRQEGLAFIIQRRGDEFQFIEWLELASIIHRWEAGFYYTEKGGWLPIY